LSNASLTAKQLENIGRLQQMKLNARLTALQAAQTLMGTPGYKESGAANSIDMITLIATAKELESYILGEIEKESIEALDEAAKRLSGPQIVRP